MLPRLLASLLLLSGLAVFAGCTTDPQVIAQANDIHQQIEPTVVTDPELAAYVQQVGDRIVQAGRELHAQGELPGEAWMFENVRFHLVASPTPNAFTTGGTHVYMYSKLFDESDSEDAFAAVVGHEFGHILGRHVQESMDQQMGILAAAGLVGLGAAAISEDGSRAETGMAAAGVAAMGGQLFGLGFGRENEREADRFGFKMHLQAGYDPDKFPNFFRTMIAAGYDTGGGIQSYLSSHPSLAERVETAEGWARGVPEDVRRRNARPPIASGGEFARLQERSRGMTQRAAAAAAAAQASGTSTPFVDALAILEAFPACVGGDADGVPPEEQPKALSRISEPPR